MYDAGRRVGQSLSDVMLSWFTSPSPSPPLRWTSPLPMPPLPFLSFLLLCCLELTIYFFSMNFVHFGLSLSFRSSAS